MTDALTNIREAIKDHLVDRDELVKAASAFPPNFEIIHGHFLTSEVRMHIVKPLPGQPKTALVMKT